MEYLIIALLAAVIVLLVILILKVSSQSKNSTDVKTTLIKTYEASKNLSQNLNTTRQELTANISQIGEKVTAMSHKNTESQLEMSKMITENIKNIHEGNLEQSERNIRRLDSAIKTMQESNEKKLEQMRLTVDEKLTKTLTTRLDSSFKTVSEQLENVYKSLGEMKELSSGVTTSVTGLNRILTNVKARGTWAEVQLENILDQTIPGMYEKNVQTNPKINGRVEFAIKIPSKQDGEITYLPIDSKFPMEDYARLTAAAENADPAALDAARKALEARVKSEAATIRKYIDEPNTTPFAIMYLATEGLYAEITSSKSAVAEKIQNDFGVLIAGPTTITALLNSLAMGFRTMAINKKADEVWKVLGEAKGQYEKFGVLLEKAQKKVEEAGKVLGDAQNRNRIIQKKLRNVEALDSDVLQDDELSTE